MNSNFLFIFLAAITIEHLSSFVALKTDTRSQMKCNETKRLHLIRTLCEHLYVTQLGKCVKMRVCTIYFGNLKGFLCATLEI